MFAPKLSRAPAPGDTTARQQPGNATLLRPLPAASRSLPATTQIQAKLRVASTTDPMEQEADRIADQVMGSSFSEVPAHGPEQIQRKCASCLEEETELQRKEQVQTANSVGGAAAYQGNGAHAPAAVSDVLSEAGQCLGVETRAFFEPRFGRDFTGVRVHTDPRAAHSARSIQARAYTAGPHIVFSNDEYRPQEEVGRRLLAHELAHTVQQRASPMLPRQQKAGVPVHTDDSGNVIRRTPCNDLLDPRLREAAQVREREVQDALMAQIPGSQKELTIPDASFTAQRLHKRYNPAALRSGPGRADLVLKNASQMEVMEIKHGDSIYKIEEGLGQLRNYIAVGNDYTNDDLRADLGIKEFVEMPPSRYPSSHIRAGGADEPVTLRWCMPGLLAYRALRDQDRDLFVCTARDQGKVDAFLNGKLSRGWAVVDEYIDKTIGPKIEAAITSMPISDLVPKLLSNPAGRKMLEKAIPGSSLILDGIDGKLVGRAAEELLKSVAPTIRRVAMEFKSRLIDRVRQEIRNRMLETLQAELNALCATATVLTMAEILDRLKNKMPKLFTDEAAVLAPAIATQMLGVMLAEAALPILEAIAIICGVIFGLIAAYFAAAALAAIEVGALIEAGIGAILKALQALVPSFASASPAQPNPGKPEAPATALV